MSSTGPVEPNTPTPRPASCASGRPLFPASPRGAGSVPFLSYPRSTGPSEAEIRSEPCVCRAQGRPRWHLLGHRSPVLPQPRRSAEALGEQMAGRMPPTASPCGWCWSVAQWVSGRTVGSCQRGRLEQAGCFSPAEHGYAVLPTVSGRAVLGHSVLWIVLSTPAPFLPAVACGHGWAGLTSRCRDQSGATVPGPGRPCASLLSARAAGPEPLPTGQPLFLSSHGQSGPCVDGWVELLGKGGG